MSTFFSLFFENFPKNFKNFLLRAFRETRFAGQGKKSGYFATIKNEKPERMARIVR